MKPKCSCRKHCEFACNDDTANNKIFRISANKFRKCVVQALITEQCLSKTSTYLCTLCAKYSEINFVQPCNENSDIYNEVHVNKVIEMIEKDIIPEHDMIKLTKTFGGYLSSRIVSDSISSKEQYKDDSFLKHYNPEAWLMKQNTLLVWFLTSLCCNFDAKNTPQCLSIVKAIEQIYLASCFNITLPLSFSSSLITYFLTGSKSAIQISAATSPSGSYSCLLNWIKSYTAVPVQCPGDCDVVSYFDNNQVLSRNWRVRYDAKSKLSVITNIIHIIPLSSSCIQNSPHLSPFQWLCNDNNHIVEKVTSLVHGSKQSFTSYQHHFIDSRLHHLAQEHNGHEHDRIDIKIHVENNKKIRESTDPSASFIHTDPYSFIPSNHPELPPQVTVGNPCMVNPCSYESVERVLEHLVTETCSGSREWTIVGCDGSPYVLGSRLVDQVFMCPHCGERVFGESLFKTHCADKHQHDVDSCNLGQFKKFRNILMQPGLGHVEINMVKCAFKLLWEVFLKDLAKMLGYNSPRAQLSAKGACDHHKSLQMIEIALFGMADELLIPYYRCRVAAGLPVSGEDYMVWLADSVDPNYMFVAKIVFTYLLAIYVFRAGIRRNNSSAIMSSRAVYMDLFYGMNMTHYQELELRDLKIRVQAPPEVTTFLQDTEAYSVSGNHSKGEAGDFILEAKNRRCKMWMPPGVPTEQRWLRVCRNFDRLEEIRVNLLGLFNVGEKDRDMQHTDLTTETLQWRMAIRTSGYLSTPTVAKNHTSLCGEPLDADLIRFQHNCSENRSAYHRHHCEGSKAKLTPIFVLPVDRTKFHDISRKTKAELQIMIMSTIDSIGEMHGCREQSKMMAQWAATKTQTKAAYIQLYKDATVCLENNHVIDNVCVPTAADDEDDEA